MIGLGIGISTSINIGYIPLIPAIIVWNDSDSWNDSSNWTE